MNSIKYIIVLILLVILPEMADGQPSGRSRRLLPGRPDTEKKKVKVFKNPEKAIKKQASKERKMKKDYELFVKKSRKRSIAIQSPEVQERMKKNHKDTKDYYKSQNKSQPAGSKKARKKYKK